MSRFKKSRVGPKFRGIHTKYLALVLLFTFCQVIGVMCALPDLSMVEETTMLVEENMACPMDGTDMCPPSLISSPERHMKDSMVMDVDHGAMIRLNPSAELGALSGMTLWTWSSVPSIVPIFIESSSVLRI